MIKLTKKEIKNNRLWEHFKSFISYPIFDSKLRKIENYDPEQYKEAFFHFQTHGRKGLTAEQIEGIKPLIDAQKNKEITLNSLIMEIFELDSKNWGWIYPINSILSYKMDRLTRLAILRIKRRLQPKNEFYGFGNRLEFYLSHPIRELWKSEFDKKLVEFNKNKL